MRGALAVICQPSSSLWSAPARPPSCANTRKRRWPMHGVPGTGCRSPASSFAVPQRFNPLEKPSAAPQHTFPSTILSALLAATLLLPSLTQPAAVHATPAADTPISSTLVSTPREALGIRYTSTAAPNSDAGTAAHSGTAASSPSLGPSAGPDTWGQAGDARARLEAALAASEALVSAPPGSEEAARAAAAAARVMGSGPWVESPPVDPHRGRVAAPATAAAAAPAKAPSPSPAAATDSGAGGGAGDTSTGGGAGAGGAGGSPLATSTVMLASGAAIVVAIAAAAVATGAVQVAAVAAAPSAPADGATDSSAAEGQGDDDRENSGGAGGGGGGGGRGGGGGGLLEVPRAAGTQAALAGTLPVPGGKGPEATAPMASTAVSALDAASTATGKLMASTTAAGLATSTATPRQPASNDPTVDGRPGSALGTTTAALPSVDATVLEPTFVATPATPAAATSASPAVGNDVVPCPLADAGEKPPLATSPSPPALPSPTASTGVTGPNAVVPPSPESPAAAAAATAAAGPATAAAASAADSTTEGGPTTDLPPATPGASGLQVTITPSLTPTRPGPFPSSPATGNKVQPRGAGSKAGTIGRTEAGPQAGSQVGLEAGPQMESQAGPSEGPPGGPQSGPQVGPPGAPQSGPQAGPQTGPHVESQAALQVELQAGAPGAPLDPGAGSSSGNTLAAAMMERIQDINKLLDEGARALEDASQAAAAGKEGPGPLQPPRDALVPGPAGPQPALPPGPAPSPSLQPAAPPPVNLPKATPPAPAVPSARPAAGVMGAAPAQRQLPPTDSQSTASLSVTPAVAKAEAPPAPPPPAPAATPRAVQRHRPAGKDPTKGKATDISSARSSPQAPAPQPPAAPPPAAKAPPAMPSAYSSANPKADAPGPPPRADASSASLLRLKSELLDLVYGTCRGVAASATQRAAVDKLVCALEARNPHPATTDALSALAGRWTLVYTSSSLTLEVLGALDQLPHVGVCDLCQTVDPVSLTATNKIDLAVPIPLSLRAESGLEVRSPRQFQVRFTRVGVDTFLETPQLVAALEIPPSISVLGATLDLSPLQRLLSPLNGGLEAAQGLLAVAAAAPRLDVPTEGAGGEGGGSPSLWMLTTYLDDTLRISRDNEGHAFVLLNDAGFGRGPDNKP